MAIISVGEKWENMTLSETAGDGFTATRTFQLISDIPDESPAVILQDNRVPQLGNLFPGTTQVFCTERSPSRTAASREEWMLNCAYKSLLSQEERDRTKEKDPLQRKATIEWTSQKVMRTYRMIKRSDYYQKYTASIEGTFEPKSATNSAGDPFEPMLEYPATEYIAVIKKNVDRIPTWLLDYEDAVNNAPLPLNFYGTTITVPKGCAKLGAIAMPKSKQENGVEYVQLSFNIHTRQFRKLRDGETDAPEPFDDEILDAGMRWRTVPISDKSKWANVEMEDGSSPSLPVPFNGSGREIDASGDAIPEDKMWWSLVAPYKRRDFSVLPLT